MGKNIPKDLKESLPGAKDFLTFLTAKSHLAQSLVFTEGTRKVRKISVTEVWSANSTSIMYEKKTYQHGSETLTNIRPHSSTLIVNTNFRLAGKDLDLVIEI